jgi:hypothetical protein
MDGLATCSILATALESRIGDLKRPCRGMFTKPAVTQPAPPLSVAMYVPSCRNTLRRGQWLLITVKAGRCRPQDGKFG